jgi:hypothetical protein
MDFEKMEKTMQFILDSQARADVELQITRKNLTRLETQAAESAKQAEADRKAMFAGFAEMRAAISKLIDSVENTRDFSQQIARLAIAAEKRVTMLEKRRN